MQQHHHHSHANERLHRLMTYALTPPAVINYWF